MPSQVHAQRVFQPLPRQLLVFFSSAKVVLQRLCCLSFLPDMDELAGAKAELEPGSEHGSAVEFGWWMDVDQPIPWGHIPAPGALPALPAAEAGQGFQSWGLGEEIHLKHEGWVMVWGGLRQKPIKPIWKAIKRDSSRSWGSSQVTGEEVQQVEENVTSGSCWRVAISRAIKILGFTWREIHAKIDLHCEINLTMVWDCALLGSFLSSGLYTRTPSKHFVLSSAPVEKGQM